MCGIVALIGNHNPQAIQKCLGLLSHRGKDGSKVYQDNNIAIGFNRLAINDESEKGMQPFEYGDYIGVFNGEIFNFKSLAKENNISLVSKCDIEIILPLFAKYGGGVIHLLDGFYSGLIFNKLTRNLYTIRDYIGKKPLFYGSSFSSEFITSELKCISDIENFECVPKGFSIIENNKISKNIKHQFLDKSPLDLKERIKIAVKKRVPENRDIPFGVFLSGGIDSSIIASIVNTLTKNVVYYSLVDLHSEDYKYVQELSVFLGIEEQLIMVSLPDRDELDQLIDQLVYQTESYNPSIISNGLATYLLSKSASEDGLKVILSGEGADELFCGYKISKDAEVTRDKSKILINNLHVTELRRLDLASMSNTIEARCPFLDKQVYEASLGLSIEQLTDKQILRDLFIEELPKDIISRKKTAFDVGSGIRKLVVEHLNHNNELERKSLKKIWSIHYPKKLAEKNYFHKYPVFDDAIDKRGIKHR
ncbi:asparagine synthase (glutamine-hydrolysing) [Winogradskyella eximia]|uniref:asparagine synthase (glutamine-hydrolyzing) n=1 Tax=Winogradskyella eximia TaxID=262006 RepID=A0A3D9H175_9FLAO|nr:asparagine synthase-related protein [Winogradskyella eximia]RED42911.1 asparagine synthase (glutamine-hydrolysing) [Winogradskyella eximia]